MPDSRRYLRAAVSLLVTLACIYILGQLRGFIHDVWVVVRSVVVPFVIAMICSYLLQPLVDILVRRRMPRGAAILTIYLAFILLSAVAVLNAIPLVSRQLTDLSQHLPSLVQQADAWIDGLAHKRQYLPEALRRGIEAALNRAEQNVTLYAAGVLSMLTNTLSFIFMLFVIPFLVFYLLKDGQAIGRAVVHLTPAKYRQAMRDILAGIDDTLGRYVRGQLLVMLVVGVLTYAGLLVVGMPYALLLALFVALTNVIPYLGPFLGAAPGLLLALSISPQMALKVLVVNVIVQQLEGNLVSPQIMGRTLQLHPMAIVAALLLGEQVGGVLGLIVAVPALAVLKVIWIHVRKLQTT
ncbi:UPF0118 membrane protein YrrI [Alicyclobacillus cellulosilyticus]|uniref:UPF0118 membrane protein YrrI n=1 Tax=Alicyclobacillus cellulosilyticus TaxID=1003997 RepID=A0A917KBC5_9BACL|nr:AI-2E family transporter [Alicyclobacillus cellulosilyticus]GGJ06376.1 UPF0118 membrane protein YrrI [Alicyclobacillus cellulosilyticus]